MWPACVGVSPGRGRCGGGSGRGRLQHFHPGSPNTITISAPSTTRLVLLLCSLGADCPGTKALQSSRPAKPYVSELKSKLSLISLWGRLYINCHCVGHFTVYITNYTYQESSWGSYQVSFVFLLPLTDVMFRVLFCLLWARTGLASNSSFIRQSWVKMNWCSLRVCSSKITLFVRGQTGRSFMDSAILLELTTTRSGIAWSEWRRLGRPRSC